MDEKIWLAAVHLLPGMSQRRLRKIHEADITFERIFRILPWEFLTTVGYRDEHREVLIAARDQITVSHIAHVIQNKNICLSTENETEYPTLLRAIDDAPFLLYSIGEMKCLESFCLAVVGSRKMSAYGRQILDHFLPAFIDAEITLVSGLAFGVDAYTHQHCVENKGKTIAVLGSGVNLPYPSSSQTIYHNIITQNMGLILSEFPLGKKPEPFHFPMRNRIIAGLSRGVLVVEAAETSGALITAHCALDAGREVFAVPGSIFSPMSVGTCSLIVKGEAALVTKPDEVLEIFGFHKKNVQAELPLDLPDEMQKVFAHLAFIPQEHEELLMKSGTTVSEFQSALTMLELQGLVRKVEGTKWVRLR